MAQAEQITKELRDAMAKAMQLDPTGATIYAIAFEVVFSSAAPRPVSQPPAVKQEAITPRTKEWFATQGREVTPKSRLDYYLHRTPDWEHTPSVKRRRSLSTIESSVSTPVTKRPRDIEEDDDVPQYEWLARS